MQSRRAFGLIAPLIFVVDRLTKLAIETKVGFWDHHVVIPGLFSIIHTQNRGAAFSLLADSSDAIRSVVLIGLSSAVALTVAVLLWRALSPEDSQSNFIRAALSLVLGGATGNLYDRIFHGTVTDFLLFYWRDYSFPVFNVADSAITVGACLLLLDFGLAGKPAPTVPKEQIDVS